MKFLPLVENEVLKLLKRRRFRVAWLILVVFISIIVYAQAQGRERILAGRPWRVETQERIARMQNWLRSGRVMLDTSQRWIRFEISRLQYHLDRNINPDAISGPLFARGFANAASYLLLPLLAIVFAADIVSSEFSQGTIKLLLTRPVGRLRVLASKLAALLLAITLTVFFGGAVAYSIGGLAFGYAGWDAPLLTGFRFAGDPLIPPRCGLFFSGRTRSWLSASPGSRRSRSAPSRFSARSSCARPRPRWGRWSRLSSRARSCPAWLLPGRRRSISL